MSKILKRRMKVSAARKAAACMGLAALPLAYAQDASKPEEMKPIVVTGSLLPTAETVGATPVETFSYEQIERTGAETVSQLIRKLPIFMGAGNFNEASGNGGDGTGRVSLRGIPGGTLVLINGRRVAPTAFAGSEVDINSIPMAAIDRIEILKDGGSSLYGSSAIAGVVNIIMKKNFNGTAIDAYYGNTTSTDVGQQQYSFITGTSNDKTSLLLGGSYYQANSLYSNDRDRSFGSATSITSNPGRFRVRNDARGGGNLYNPGAAADAPVFVTVNRSAVPGANGRFAPGDFHLTGNNPENVFPGDRFPFPIYTPAVRPSERYGFFGNASHKLFENDALEFFAEGSWTRSDTYNQLAPTPISSGTVGYPVPANNYYNPFGADVTSWNYRTVELGPRTDTITYDYFRFVTGLRGRINESSWNWEAAMLWSESRGANVLGGELSRSRLQTAMNDTTAAAFNPFGNQANSQAQLDAVKQNLYALGESTLWSVDAKVAGEVYDLPAGPIGFAGGLAHEEQRGKSEPDGPTTSADTVGFNSDTALYGARDVEAIFAEISIPIFSEQNEVTGLHSLSLSSSFRYEDYSDFGDTVNPKVTLRWQPVDETITVRGSYSTSFLAPTFSELYTAQQADFPEVRNPYLPPNDPNYFTQFQTFNYGNPNLEPQEAENYTAGIVWSPKNESLKGLTLGFDWFKIDMENIPGGSVQYIVDQNARTGGPSNRLPGGGAGVNPTPGQYADLITFDPVDNSYTSVNVPTLNLSQAVTEGFDVSATYELPTDSYGRYTFSAVGTYYYKFDQETIPGTGFIDRLGDYSVDDFGFESIPRFRGVFSLFWNMKGIEFGVTANYTYHYRDDANAGFDREIDDYLSFDLQASYDFTGNTKYKWLDQTKITVGVLNIADEEPPAVLASFADNYDRALNDLRQRFVYVSLAKKF